MSLEQLSRSQDGPSLHILENLYWLEDELAYALGALEEWNSLDGLDLPASRLKLARLYLILGSLHLNLPSLSQDTIALLLRTGTLDRQQIAHVLQERFGEDSYVAKAAVAQFEHWYRQRTEPRRQQFERWLKQQS